MSGGWAGGQACYPSVKMAIEDVNNNITMLPGYKLVLMFKNSKVSDTKRIGRCLKTFVQYKLCLNQRFFQEKRLVLKM